jgi:ribokinase
MSKKILIIGSSNTDMVVRTGTFPKPGQTVLGGSFLMNPGGKGANQAVAAARLGGDIRFITKTGEDIFGQQAIQGFEKEGLDISYARVTTDFASGIALITVSESGENQIVVASGANMDLKPEDLPQAAFKDVEYALVQLEIPIETVAYAIEKCWQMSVKVVLNPAPAALLNDDLLGKVYLITPNETETELITGIMPDSVEKMERAAKVLLAKGVQNVMITLGKKGVFFLNKYQMEIIPAINVIARDTTAAGDVFNGALVTALADGRDFRQAAEFACKAAALSVTRIGAQSSAPYLNEIF